MLTSPPPMRAGEHKAWISASKGRVPSIVTVTAALTPGVFMRSDRKSALGFGTACSP